MKYRIKITQKGFGFQATAYNADGYAFFRARGKSEEAAYNSLRDYFLMSGVKLATFEKRDK